MSEWTRPAQPVRCVVELDKPLAVHRERGILAQGDANANAIVAEVYSTAGKPYDLSGCAVQLIFVRPDNNALPAINAEISGNTAIVTLPDSAYAMSGMYSLRMQLRKNGAERTIVWIIGEVKGTDVDGIADPEHVISIGDIMASAKEAQTAASNANAAAQRANAGAERAEQLQIDASGLAGDALKLGGKPPEAYAAVDLLDNNNFEIAQAGYGGLHGNTKYAADRWQANNHDGTTYQRTSGGLMVTSSAAYEGQIMQVVADSAALVGKTLTYAVKGLSEFGKLGMLAYCYDANDNIVQKNFLEPNFSELTVRTITFTVPANTAKIRCYINNRAADTYTVEWAALYEGSYTAETLPPFVPPDLLNELEKCQYYFRRIKGANYAMFGVGVVRLAHVADFFISVGKMRIDNVSISTRGKFSISVAGGTFDVSAISLDTMARSNHGILIRAEADGDILSGYLGQTALLQANNNTETYIDISADL